MFQHKNILILFLLLSFQSCQKEETITHSGNTFIPTTKANSISAFEDEVDGVPLIIVGHSKNPGSSDEENLGLDNQSEWEFVLAFDRRLDDDLLVFSVVDDEFPVILKDQNGNLYDVSGSIVEGPAIGKKLTSPNSGIGYWFALASAFPGIGINDHFEPNPDLAMDPASIVLEDAHICTAAGFDVIHALTDPKFSHVSEAETGAFSYLTEEDLVIGVVNNGEAKAYPHAILSYHEIINDVVGGEHITVSYCPLTGTAKVWKRQSEYESFGVSGQLYNSNLLLFDQDTESRWWQIAGRAILGDRQGEEVKILSHVEMKWKDWLEKMPDSEVVNSDTGYPRNYALFPYGSYPQDHTAILVPVAKFSEELIRAKDRVFVVIIGTTAKVYLPDIFI